MFFQPLLGEDPKVGFSYRATEGVVSLEIALPEGLPEL